MTDFSLKLTKNDLVFLYYCCGFLLCLSFIREILGFQVYFNSIVPVVFAITILFFDKDFLNSRFIYFSIFFLLASLIQYAHPSYLDLIYLIKIATLALTMLLLLKFFKDDRSLNFFIYFTLLVSLSLTLIEFLTVGLQSRTLFFQTEVIRLHGIFGHHNYSGIIYILISSICFKRNLFLPFLTFLTLAFLTGSNGVYLYIICAIFCLIFNLRVAKFFILIFFWISWLLPFWFPIFLELIPNELYELIAVLTNYRSVHWEVYSNIAQSNLLFGTGYVNAFDLYSVFSNHAIDNFANVQIQHNLSLEVLTGYGIFFWILIGLIISLLVTQCRSRYQNFYVSMIFLPYVFYNGLTFIGLWLAAALLLNEMRSNSNARTLSKKI